MKQILFLLAICIAIQTTPSFAERTQVKRNISDRTFVVKSRMATANELQSLADAAALAGTSAIKSENCPTCTARQRWDNAKEAALQVIQSSSAGVQLAFDKKSPTYKIEAEIERGRWLPKKKLGRQLPGTSDKKGDFESFEGNWQAKHPGVPNFLAFNAVRVTLKKSINVNNRTRRFISTRAKSTAVVSLPQNISVAPLAIPVCALLDDNGDYNPKDLCLADRLFAATNQHCPAGTANCGNIPQFSWDPRPSSNSYWAYWNSLYNIESSSGANNIITSQTEYLQDQACFWASPRYQKPFNNYGVIGMPMEGQYAPFHPSEEVVTSAITEGRLNASIGGKFYVLTNGLSEPASEEAIWKRIINKDGAEGQVNPLFYTISSLRPGSGQGNKSNINYNSYFQKSDDRNKCVASSPSRFYYPKPDETFWPGEIGGTCNSRRSGWGHWSSFSNNERTLGLISFYNPEAEHSTSYDPNNDASIPYSNHFSNLPVWQVSLAVIADRNSKLDCSNMAASTTPIGVGPYEIIGFIKTYIYDVDLGGNPPTFPDNTGVPFSSERIGWHYWTQESFNGLSPSDPLHPWGFTSPEGTPIPCNLIRSRLACNQSILPAAQGGGTSEISPVLVPDSPAWELEDK